MGNAILRAHMPAVTDEPDELLDLVDEHDIVVGAVMRNDVARQGLSLPGLVRASNAFILSDRGELFVPRRAPHKVVAPNGLDYSAGEHVKSGETYLQGMIRGFQEELNLQVTEGQLEYLGKVDNRPASLPYFSALYLYRSNDAPDYNKDDFVSHEWLTPEAFLARLEAGEPAKRDMPLSLKLLIEYLSRKGK